MGRKNNLQKGGNKIVLISNNIRKSNTEGEIANEEKV
jgi:hypothetical protein